MATMGEEDSWDFLHFARDFSHDELWCDAALAEGRMAT
jgi:hypothetical protein